MSSPTFQWVTHYPYDIVSNANSSTGSIATMADGTSYITFKTSGTVSGGTNSGQNDIVVSKISSSGTFIWTKQHSAVNTIVDDYDPMIAVDGSGNAYVVYKTSGTVSGGTNISLGASLVVFKLNSSGVTQWVTQDTIVNTEFDNTYPVIAADNSGNVYVSYATDASVSSGTNSGSYDIVLLKLDTNGVNQWIIQQPAMNTGYDDITPSLAVDSNGNSYITYSTDGTVSGGTNFEVTTDIVIAKVNTSGSIVWIKQLESMNTNGSDTNPYIAVDTSGNVYATYRTPGTVSGGTSNENMNMVVFKMDTDGNLLWIQQTADMNGLDGDAIPSSLAVDASGNVLVGYTVSGSVSGGTHITAYAGDVVLAKLDTNGNLIWIKQDDTINTSFNGAYEGRLAVSADSNGNLYGTYTTTGTVSGGVNDGYFNVVVFKVSDSGSTTWIKEQANITSLFGGNNMVVAADNQGNSYVVYTTVATVSGGIHSGSNDVVVSKLDTNGSVVWTKQYTDVNTAGPEFEPSIVADTNGNVYVAYHTYGSISGGVNTGESDIVVFKMNTNGQLQWVKQDLPINTIYSESTAAIAADSAGNIYITYHTYGAISGGIEGNNSDVIVAKMDTNGQVQWIVQDPVLNTDGYDMNPKIAVDSSGNVYVLHYSSGTVSGGTNITNFEAVVVTKLNTNGIIQWVKQDPAMTVAYDPDMEQGIYDHSIAVDTNGNVYVAYNTNGTASGSVNVGQNDIVLFKLSPSGTLLWIKQDLVLNTDVTEWHPSLSTDIYNNLYISYHSEGTVSGGTASGNSNVVVAKLNSNGDIQWITEDPTINIGAYNFNPSIVVDTNGTIFVAYGNYTNVNSISVVKYAQNGFNPSSLYCLAKGTQILTPQGYVLIESLKKGDSIVTGDKRIVQIESIHTTFFSKTTKQTAPYTIEKDAFGKNCPPNMLQVSGKHAIQIGEGLWEMPEEAAKSNPLVKQAPLGESVRYYHVALPDYAKDTLVANGQIVDSLNTGKYRESYVWNNLKNGYMRILTLSNGTAKKLHA
jgi:hypothetical protein